MIRFIGLLSLAIILGLQTPVKAQIIDMDQPMFGPTYFSDGDTLVITHGIKYQIDNVRHSAEFMSDNWDMLDITFDQDGIVYLQAKYTGKGHVAIVELPDKNRMYTILIH